MNLDWIESSSAFGGVRGSVAAVAQAIFFLPLANTEVIRSVTGCSVPQVTGALRVLRRRGLIGSDTLGWYQRRCLRYWLSDSAFADGVPSVAFPHLAGGRQHLVDRLPVVETFYHLLCREQETLGPFRSFAWFDGVSFDAVAVFRDGWFCFFWSGLCQSQSYLRSRLDNFVSDIVRFTDPRHGPARPACLYFVVSDYWQGQVLARVLGEMGLAGMARFAFIPESLYWGLTLEPGMSSGALLPECRYREPQDPDWSRFVAQHYAGAPLGVDVSSYLLDFLAQWPDVDRPLLLKAFRSSQGRRCLALERFLSLSPAVKAGGSLSLSRLGMHYLRRRDAVPDSFSFNTIGPPVQPRLALHERGLRFVVSGFAAEFCETAVGTRAYESLPGAGISPDGLVYFVESPFGPGWHYLEYERRVRGAARAAAKLKGYLAKPVGSRFPLLMVCRDAGTEAVFNEVAEAVDPGFQMALTTVPESQVLGPDGMPGCWRVRGVPVRFK